LQNKGKKAKNNIRTTTIYNITTPRTKRKRTKTTTW
jgi:hypothetical protein